MPLTTSPEEDQVLGLLHEALGLQRGGLLPPEVLEDIETKIRLLCTLNRRKMARAFKPGPREEAGARLDREAGLNDQAEYALTPELRIVYHLLNARFGKLVPYFTIVKALSGVRPDLAAMSEDQQQDAVGDLINGLYIVILFSGNHGKDIGWDILAFRDPPCMAYRLVDSKN